MIFELNELPKTKTYLITYQDKFPNILQHHRDHIYGFTNGSEDNEKKKKACAAVLNKIIIKKSLRTENSIFTAEACATDLALDIISKSKHKKFIIFSDSLSVFLSLNNKKNWQFPNYLTTEKTRLNLK